MRTRRELRSPRRLHVTCFHACLEAPEGVLALRRSVLNMGLPPQLTTTYNAACQGPVQMAVDPKWSTDLKRRPTQSRALK